MAHFEAKGLSLPESAQRYNILKQWPKSLKKFLWHDMSAESCHPAAYPDLCFHSSLSPVASTDFMVRSIVCVVCNISEFEMRV